MLLSLGSTLQSQQSAMYGVAWGWHLALACPTRQAVLCLLKQQAGHRHARRQLEGAPDGTCPGPAPQTRHRHMAIASPAAGR